MSGLFFLNISIPRDLHAQDIYDCITFDEAGIHDLQNDISGSGSCIGSLGNETTLFGNATKYALIQYQKSKGIKPAIGNFGPLTKNAILKDLGIK